MKRFIAALVIAITLPLLAGFGGCTSTPTTPLFDLAKSQRDVFSAKEAYGVAEKVAIVYAQLKRCAAPPVQPCSDQKVVDQIVRARNIARDSLAAAQSAVDNPAFGKEAISTAVIAAKSGLKAFETIAAQPGVQ